MSVIKKEVDMVKVCDDCFRQNAPWNNKNVASRHNLNPNMAAMGRMTPNPRSNLSALKKVRSETHLVGTGGGGGGNKGGDKALIASLYAQIDDIKAVNYSLTTRLQLLREHNAKLKIKLLEKEQEIKGLLLKQLDTPSGGLRGLPLPEEVESPKRRGLPSPNGSASGKKRKSPVAPPKRSSTFNLLNSDPDKAFSPMSGGDVDLIQSTTEVIVDGVEYKDYSDDEEEYDDSLDEENGGKLIMSTSSTPLSLVSGNRQCASCKKDIMGRAVRAGDAVYHKRCHDKQVVGTI